MPASIPCWPPTLNSKAWPRPSAVVRRATPPASWPTHDLESAGPDAHHRRRQSRVARHQRHGQQRADHHRRSTRWPSAVDVGALGGRQQQRRAGAQWQSVGRQLTGRSQAGHHRQYHQQPKLDLSIHHRNARHHARSGSVTSRSTVASSPSVGIDNADVTANQSTGALSGISFAGANTFLLNALSSNLQREQGRGPRPTPSRPSRATRPTT